MSKAVFLTGASSGLGRALAQVLCAEGHWVAGLGRRQDALDETRALCGDAFLPLVCDVANAQAVERAAAQAKEAHGSAKILINNAALYPRRDILDETPDSFQQTLAVNLGGCVAAVHAVLPDMVAAGRGRIMSVGSFADIAPLPASAAYAVSKGAARIYTRALIADLADRFPHIVINDWMPGILATEMGIPDGLAPETAARWGAALALMEDPSLTGTVFEMGQEILPPQGLKQKMKSVLTFSRPRPREITPLQVATLSQ